jgi:hypothetical protein
MGSLCIAGPDKHFPGVFLHLFLLFNICIWTFGVFSLLLFVLEGYGEVHLYGSFGEDIDGEEGDKGGYLIPSYQLRVLGKFIDEVQVVCGIAC